MQRNHGTEVPYHHVVVDTETEPFQSDVDGTQHHRLVYGHAVFWCRRGRRISRRKMIRFEEAHDFWRWFATVLDPHRPTWLWIYNLNFDLPILDFFQEWEQGRYVDKKHCLENAPTFLSGHYEDKRVVVMDLHNYFPQGVKELGKWIGLPKLKRPAKGASEAEEAAYCTRDVEIVERVVNRLCDWTRDLDLGCLRMTLASQALRHFQHLPDSTLPLIPTGGHETRLARAAYYGARVEPFFCGRVWDRVYVYDVNGIYGHVMGTCKLPWKLADYTRCGNVVDLESRVDPKRCAARVWLQTEEPYPVRVLNVGTCWCVGEFVTHLCGVELARALAAGHVRQVYELAVYDLEYGLKPFADYWWRKRCEYKREGDTIMAQMAKAMPCCLYGKWAERKPRWQPIGEVIGGQRWGAIRYQDHETGLHHRGRVINGMGEVDVSRGFRTRPSDGELEPIPAGLVLERDETDHSFPAVSAFIVAYARELMDQFRAAAGERNVYYQVSDCIHVNAAGHVNLHRAGLVDPDARGKLKLKDWYEWVDYHGVNCLRINGKLSAAGLSNLHVEKKDGTIEATSFEKLDSLLLRIPNGTVQVRTSQWKPSLDYKHSLVGPDGWCRPHRLTLGLTGAGLPEGEAD